MYTSKGTDPCKNGLRDPNLTISDFVILLAAGDTFFFFPTFPTTGVAVGLLSNKGKVTVFEFYGYSDGDESVTVPLNRFIAFADMQKASFPASEVLRRIVRAAKFERVSWTRNKLAEFLGINPEWNC